MLLEVMTGYRGGSGEWRKAPGGCYGVGDADVLCASDMAGVDI